MIQLASGTGEEASIDLGDPGAGMLWVLGRLQWSMSAAPSSVTYLRVFDGSDVIFDVDITAAGVGFINFDNGLEGSAGRSLKVSLGSGGAGVVGKLNIQGRKRKTNVVE